MDPESKLAVLEQQVNNFSRYFEKMDATLDKLTELSASIEKIVAVHDQRLNVQEDAKETLTEGQKLVHRRIDRLKEDINLKLDSFDSKLDGIERWRWIFLGAMTGIMFVVTNMETIAKFLMG